MYKFHQTRSKLSQDGQIKRSTPDCRMDSCWNGDSRTPMYLYRWDCMVCVCVCVQSLSPVQLFRPCGLYPAKLLCPRNSPAKNTGMDCHFLLQGIFLTHRPKPCLSSLLHCMQILYHWATRYLRLSFPSKWCRFTLSVTASFHFSSYHCLYIYTYIYTYMMVLSPPLDYKCYEGSLNPFLLITICLVPGTITGAQ